MTKNKPKLQLIKTEDHWKVEKSSEEKAKEGKKKEVRPLTEEEMAEVRKRYNQGLLLRLGKGSGKKKKS